MELVLGIDLGTSYFKLGLFDRKGKVRGLSRVFVLKETHDGSRCELPVGRFWELLNQGLSEACNEANSNRGDIEAISYSSQANSFVLLDDNNQPLTPLILWPDSRVKRVDKAVRELWQRNDFLKKTGLGIGSSPQFCVTKLRWFQQNQPAIWSRVNRIMTISDYLTFGLTGQTVGDEGTASLLGLWDLQNHDWWDEALQMLGLSRPRLSKPLGLGTVAGTVNAEGAKRLEIKNGVALAVGSLDHHIAAIGAGIGQEACVSESTGTVLACLCCSEQYRPKTNCCMGPHHGREWYQLVFSGNGALALEWYQKHYAPDISIDELMKLAGLVDIGSNGLIALPSLEKYQGLAGFLNMSAEHQHGSFVRAIMESTAATLAGLIVSLCPGGTPEKIVATGGGARSNLWLQIKADLLGAEFMTTDCQESACLGAAMLAGVAAGWFENLDQASAAWVSVLKKFSPTGAGQKAYTQWYKSYLEQVSKSRLRR